MFDWNAKAKLGVDSGSAGNLKSNSCASHSNVGQDAYGYVLGYYWDNSGRKDYKPINNAAQSLYTNSYTLTTTSDDLFNGNIKEMSTALAMPNGTGTPTALPLIFNRYHYDQLNRIKSQTSYTGASTNTYATLTATGEYSNTFTYDAAGNISTQFRNGTTAAGQSMDNLTYYYYKSTSGTYTMTATGGAPTDGTNKLAYVDDGGTSGNYSDDLEDQSAGNYTYDAIGNLITDASEEIDLITWNVYGKIETITRDAASNKPDLEFIYDAFGQRIGKIVKTRNGSGRDVQDEWLYTYYMRDASGNVMATYSRSFTEVSVDVVDKLQLKETHLYGASRTGIKDREAEAFYSDVTRTYTAINLDKEYIFTGVTATTAMNDPDLQTPERELGNKQYEFSNHLGNVLVTLSDRKTQVNNAGNIDYFMSDVRSYSDYSAFGVQLAGRYEGTYRYGNNSKEYDGETSTYDYGFRIYNARLGRFLSVDPLTREYPWYTTYQFAGNSPIACDDLDGLEPRPRVAPSQRGRNIPSNTPHRRIERTITYQSGPNSSTSQNSSPRNNPGATRGAGKGRGAASKIPPTPASGRPVQVGSLSNGEPHDFGGYGLPPVYNPLAITFQIAGLAQNIKETNPTVTTQSVQPITSLTLEVQEVILTTFDVTGMPIGSKTKLVVTGPGATEFYTMQAEWEAAYDAEINGLVLNAMREEYYGSNQSASGDAAPQFTDEEIAAWKTKNWSRMNTFRVAAKFN